MVRIPLWAPKGVFVENCNCGLEQSVCGLGASVCTCGEFLGEETTEILISILN